MILPAIISALALAGAPSNTTVLCQPNGLPGSVSGLTYWADRHIELDYRMCGGLLLLSVDQPTRQKILRLNPGYDYWKWMGMGALAILHEANHLAANSQDEGYVECRAISQVDEFLAKFLNGQDLDNARTWAHAMDQALGSAYHGTGCQVG